MLHKKKVLIGAIFGVIYWLAASLLAVGQGQMYGRYTEDVRKKVNYANTITAKITAKKMDGNQIQGRADEDNLLSERPSRQTIEEYVKDVFGDSGWGYITCLIDCESSFDSMAVSPNGLYIGLLQFEERTYYSNGGTDIWDWQEMIRIAKRLYDKGEVWRWPACNKRCSVNVVEM